MSGAGEYIGEETGLRLRPNELLSMNNTLSRQSASLDVFVLSDGR